MKNAGTCTANYHLTKSPFIGLNSSNNGFSQKAVVITPKTAMNENMRPSSLGGETELVHGYVSNYALPNFESHALCKQHHQNLRKQIVTTLEERENSYYFSRIS